MQRMMFSAVRCDVLGETLEVDPLGQFHPSSRVVANRQADGRQVQNALKVVAQHRPGLEWHSQQPRPQLIAQLGTGIDRPGN
ncbi:hypothetical protein PQR75_43970 [Paraburkholderia fungorum]|uniref:hypothetical protein n=1 Tax=Paraburkholderia fungorum TaxID=134537 RepID=UPI0038BB78BD